MSRNVRSALALLLLTLFLGSGAAYALPAEGPGPDREPGMLTAIWNWVTSVVEAKVPFFQIHENVGLPQPPVQQNGQGGNDGEGGAFIDPFG